MKRRPVGSQPVALSVTALQTLQSSAQRRHGAVSASPKRIVGTDGVGPGRSPHSYQSKFGELVGSCLTITNVPFAHVIVGKCRQPAVAAPGDLLGCQDRLQPFESCQKSASHRVTVDLTASSSSLPRRVLKPRAVAPVSCSLFPRTKHAAPDQLNQAPAARLYGTGGPAESGPVAPPARG
jgi:hypothetical protein